VRDYKVPDHPYVISTATNIADLALVMNNYDLALQYAEIVISRDPKNKFAYHTKGCVLSKLQRYQEAIAAFDAALALDPGYADATLHRLEVLAEVANSSLSEASSSSAISLITEAIITAENLQPSSYDETYTCTSNH
jgi:tetratricopeptide (TPR) repeat protein